MIKIFSTITAAIVLSACSHEITVKQVPVISHTSVTKALDGCDRLGPVKIKYEANANLNQRENELQAQDLLKQHAYDEYRANNIVILHARYIEGAYREKDIVSGRGIAYMCYDSENSR